MISYKMARRSFLRDCGGAAALLGPLLRGIEARAEGMPAPLRFLIIHHPLGTQLDLWRPAAAATTTSFTLPRNSAAFEPLRSKMVMIDGLNIVAGNTGNNTHEGGVVAVMTGQPTLGRVGTQDHCAGGASIDQLFLDRSPVLGGAAAPMGMTKTPASMQLAADIRSDRDEVSPRVLSYRPPITGESDISRARQPLYPDTQPLSVYNKYFATIAGGGMSTSDTAKLLAQKLSVIDFMRKDLARLRTLVPANDRVRLEAHVAAIQNMENKLRQDLTAPITPALACTKPTAPRNFSEGGAGASGGLAPPGGSQLKGVDYFVPGMPTVHPHQEVGRLQLSLIKTAFLCDITRVASFMWSPGTNWVVFPGSFDGATLPNNPSSPHHPPTHTTDVNTVAWVAAIDRWYAQQTAAALMEMDAAVDVDGNKLLDNTVVVYVSEISRAYDHAFQNTPFAVFGGKNTRIKGGTFLKVTDGPLGRLSATSTGGEGTGNRPTNDAFLALAPIFGITDLTRLGAGAQSTGPLPGLVT